MYITKSAFVVGKDRDEIEPGSEVSAKDLGVSAEKCKEYLALGLLVEKPAGKKSAAKADAAAEQSAQK